MTVVQVLSLSRSLSPALQDGILSATEQALDELGAVRIWIESSGAALTVVAEFTQLP